MGKHDHPTLQFTVENGRLAPASPYEQEVLDTYQRGAQLTVTLNQKRSLPILRKYWAVLRDVVQNCKTPWNSTDEASDALKLALGVTDISKTVHGQWFIRPGSISFTSMDEAAFRDFFEKAMAVLSEVTGIDPDELRQRYNHIPEQESSDTPPDDNGSGASPEPPSSAAATNSPDVADQEAGAQDMGENAEAPASIDPDWLKQFAKAMLASIGPDEAVVVNQSKGLFVEGLSADVSAKARSIVNYARACCRDELEISKCREMVAGIAGVDVGELSHG